METPELVTVAVTIAGAIGGSAVGCARWVGRRVDKLMQKNDELVKRHVDDCREQRVTFTSALERIVSANEAVNAASEVSRTKAHESTLDVLRDLERRNADRDDALRRILAKMAGVADTGKFQGQAPSRPRGDPRRKPPSDQGNARQDGAT